MNLDELRRTLADHAAGQPPGVADPVGAVKNRLRRARRRRVMSVVTVALAAAAALSGAAIVASRPGQTSRRIVTHPAPSATTAPTVSPTTQPPSTAVPAGFQPGSVTFVSSREGWVLGTAGCAARPCAAALVHTTDGGQSWHAVTPPPVPFDRIALPGVSRVRFGDTRNGYAFGPGLLATHDGGTTWQRVTLPDAPSGTAVAALEISGGTVEVYVVLPPASPGGNETGVLYRSPVGHDGWIRAAGVSITRNGDLVGTATLALHGRAGWLVETAATSSGSGDALLASPDGVSWHSLGSPCPAQTFLNSVAAASTNDVVVACGGGGAAGSESKLILVSRDGGTHFNLTAASPPVGGDLEAVTTPQPGTIVVAAAQAASYLYATFDNGRTWSTVVGDNSGGQNWQDLGFTNATQGVVIEGSPVGQDGGTTPTQPPTRLWTTTDGGHHWHSVTLASPAPTGPNAPARSASVVPADAQLPAAGYCPAANGPIATIVLNPDVPTPRCLRITEAEQLQIVNRTAVSQSFVLGPLHANIAAGATQAFPALHGFAPGVHVFRLSAPPFSGELWLPQPDGTWPGAQP